MKNIKLFENFDKDKAKDLAEEALEDFVNKAFPEHTYANPGNEKPGDYTIYNDTAGDGTPLCFVDIYLTPEEYNTISKQIDDDYDKYVKSLQEFLDNYAIESVNSIPSDNAISVSIEH